MKIRMTQEIDVTPELFVNVFWEYYSDQQTDVLNLLADKFDNEDGERQISYIKSELTTKTLNFLKKFLE